MIASFSRFMNVYEHAFLSEARKNTHLTHLEDVLLDDGPAGAPFALNILQEFGRILNGGTVSRSLNVSVKWDGAPALIFGPDPADGRFFVATKGAFAKTPKLAKTHADIDALYQSGVKTVLHLALDYLSQLKPTAVLQGDVLFTAGTTQNQIIDGRTYITFKPNTILYAVGAETELSGRIRSAQIGIVVHTMYTGSGPNILSYGATAITPQVFSTLKRTTSVLAMDAGYDDLSGTVTFTAQERNDYYMLCDAVAALVPTVDGRVYATITQEPLHALIQQFLNAQVRQNKQLSPAQYVSDLVLFIMMTRDKEMAGRSTEAGKATQRQRFDSVLESVRLINKPLIGWFALYNAISRAKEMVVRKLGQASRVAAFVPTDTGFRVTGPEGFVAVMNDGKAVKLVDRLEFSRLNFLAPKSWQ
jgi:hypothetical protein